MNDGINTYEIKYYGENDEVIKTSQFIIVKESPAPAPVQTSAETTPTAASASGSATETEKKPL